jgi:D-tyrosyl-tRNA(Tyr) deacylase
MRVVIQKVKSASVSVKGDLVSSINRGFMILLGIEDADTDADIEWLCNKIMKLRVFDDADGVMNLAITDIPDTDILVVSQFTLMASTKKGARPSYLRASKPEFSKPMYERFVARLSEMMGHALPTGRFGTVMEVALVNDGPTTILIDSHLRE